MILPRSRLRLLRKHSSILSFRKNSPFTISFLTQRLKRPILLKASVSLLVPSSSLLAPDKLLAPKLDKSKAKNRFNT